MPHRPGLAVAALLSLVLSPNVGAELALDEDFEADVVGAAPASASAVRSGEGFPAVVVGPEGTPGQWTIDTDQAWHGEQSLRMEGRRPYMWQVLNHRALENVFSVYLKGDRAGQEVELGIENIRMGDESGIWVLGRATKTVTLGDDWARHVLPSVVTDEQIESAGAITKSMGADLFRVWVRPLSDAPVHAFKGKDYVEIEHTFENAEPQLSTAVRPPRKIASHCRFPKRIRANWCV